MNAHLDDILVCANLAEGRDYRQFSDRQVFTLARPDRLRGRRVRTVWISTLAQGSYLTPEWDSQIDALARLGATVRPVEKWEPDEPINLIDQLRALPEQLTGINTQTGEYRRGYAKAIEDACALVTSTIVSALD